MCYYGNYYGVNSEFFALEYIHRITGQFKSPYTLVSISLNYQSLRKPLAEQSLSTWNPYFPQNLEYCSKSTLIDDTLIADIECTYTYTSKKSVK